MSETSPEVIEVREGETFEAARVEAYLREHIPDLDGAMEVRQFSGGHANLTYLLRFGERELVLRRPPLGPVAPRSHDMGREYRVLSRLADHYAPAPRAFHLCEDEAVLGARFVVMERRHGVVVRGRFPRELDRHPDARRRVSFALIDGMADLHAVDFAAIGLADLGKPKGFALRQVEGWKGRWEKARNVEIPLFDELHAWLVEHLPASQGESLVHNDLKLDNCMIDPDDPDRLAAILDWDMTTLGDPLIDLGTLLAYWIEAGDPPDGSIHAVTTEPGFPTRRELARRYAERRGIDVRDIRWYEAFAHWKTAVVLQQIYIRYVRGQTDDPRFAAMEDRVPSLIERARQVAHAGA